MFTSVHTASCNATGCKKIFTNNQSRHHLYLAIKKSGWKFMSSKVQYCPEHIALSYKKGKKSSPKLVSKPKTSKPKAKSKPKKTAKELMKEVATEISVEL